MQIKSRTLVHYDVMFPTLVEVSADEWIALSASWTTNNYFRWLSENIGTNGQKWYVTNDGFHYLTTADALLFLLAWQAAME